MLGDWGGVKLIPVAESGRQRKRVESDVQLAAPLTFVIIRKRSTIVLASHAMPPAGRMIAIESI